MENSANSEAEERIATLERKIRDMEALVRGLTAELLDLKKVAMGMSRQDSERSRQDLKKGTVVRGTIVPYFWPAEKKPRHLQQPLQMKKS